MNQDDVDRLFRADGRQDTELLQALRAAAVRVLAACDALPKMDRDRRADQLMSHLLVVRDSVAFISGRDGIDHISPAGDTVRG